MSVAEPTPASPPPAAPIAPRIEALRRYCANCGAELHGPFCHACGQPEKTPIRDLLSLTSDAAGYVFDLDSRLLRTLGLLFFRPGRLTEQYLSGKRVSFVKPLRMYLVVSFLMFIAIGIGTQSSEQSPIQFKLSDPDSGSVQAEGAQTPEETLAELDKAQAQIAQERSTASPAGAIALDAVALGLEQAREEVRAEMSAQAAAAGEKAPAENAAATEPGAAGEPAQPAAAADQSSPRKDPYRVSFNDKPWHEVDNPVHIDMLGEAGNRQLNAFVGLVLRKAEIAEKEPERLSQEFFQVLPQAMFFLLPLFALLLKGVLIFKRRLYLEHLMVALHSHTFLFAATTCLLLLALADGLGPAWLQSLWGWLTAAIWIWIPLYLLLMQKRVYRQSWLGALFTYGIVGTLYTMLISFTALGALLVSLTHL